MQQLVDTQMLILRQGWHLPLGYEPGEYTYQRIKVAPWLLPKVRSYYPMSYDLLITLH